MAIIAVLILTQSIWQVVFRIGAARKDKKNGIGFVEHEVSAFNERFAYRLQEMQRL